MTIAPFEELPDTARLWSFGTEATLDDRQESALRRGLAPFLDEWTAHSVGLAAGFEVLEGRFLLVAVDEGVTQASGCSIDALVHRLRALESELGVRLVDSSPIWYRAGVSIRRVTRAQFLALAAGGEVTGDTPVFDLTLENVGQFRAGRFEIPAADGWHGRLLRAAGSGARGRSVG